MANKNLHKASKAKNDEFYTQLSDIENELKHYKKHLKNKIIFCNCDDPKESNFYHYFSQNFEHLGLKKLISTHFKKDKPSYKLEIQHDINHDGKINKLDTITTPLKQNGDFRSPECIDILKQADIVVTNPPFSLFREYIDVLMKYDKKFILIGHQNAITYKEIFRLIKGNRIWLGYGFRGGAGHFINKHYIDYATAGSHKEGMIRVSGVNWFSNLETIKRQEDLFLLKTYKHNEAYYPKYDNYNAINIDKTKEIPKDYKGYMGVPITFMDKYNPEQFEIIALGIVNSIDFICSKKMEILKDGKPTHKFTMNAKGTLYRLYNPKIDKYPSFRNVDTGELYKSIYARVIIKNKKVEV
jgi:hypothetical protein